MQNKYSIALLPLDNRPVSYLLPKQIAEFSGIDLLLPERKYLGDLKESSNLSYLENWLLGLKDLLLVISLDSWVYGGLVQSRKHTYDLEYLRQRVVFIKNLTNVSKYGFTSIMRIPNYNSDEEEKYYWKDYGKKLFEWSELMCKVGRDIPEDLTREELLDKWYESSKKIPVEILADYKAHRDKNLTINMHWLELLQNKCFEYLIFSCDDSAKYGMNVVEADYINKQVKSDKFLNRAKVISGTDEIPVVLLTKCIIEKTNIKPSISLYFNSESGKEQIAKYESNTIYSSITNQINTFGLEIKEDSDIVLFVHLNDSLQGDHIFKTSEPDTAKNAEKLIVELEKNKKPFILLDLAYANGADPLLVEKLIQSKINWDLCYGYSAWNTCSNSTGSALSIGVNRWIAEKRKVFNLTSFKKCLLVRFLDDYAYQAKVRHVNIAEAELKEKMSPFVDRFCKMFSLDRIDVKFSLPWKRSFEIEINV